MLDYDMMLDVTFLYHQKMVTAEVLLRLRCYLHEGDLVGKYDFIK